MCLNAVTEVGVIIMGTDMMRNLLVLFLVMVNVAAFSIEISLNPMWVKAVQRNSPDGTFYVTGIWTAVDGDTNTVFPQFFNRDTLDSAAVSLPFRRVFESDTMAIDYDCEWPVSAWLLTAYRPTEAGGTEIAYQAVIQTGWTNHVILHFPRTVCADTWVLKPYEVIGVSDNRVYSIDYREISFGLRGDEYRVDNFFLIRKGSIFTYQWYARQEAELRFCRAGRFDVSVSGSTFLDQVSLAGGLIGKDTNGASYCWMEWEHSQTLRLEGKILTATADTQFIRGTNGVVHMENAKEIGAYRMDDQGKLWIRMFDGYWKSEEESLFGFMGTDLECGWISPVVGK